MGISAGRSAVLNTFYERQDEVCKVVNVCSRLMDGENVHPDLAEASKVCPSFTESVVLFEVHEQKIPPRSKEKMLTMRPLLDEMVLVSTTKLEEATKSQVISIEHMLSIALTMTLYSQRIIDFIET